MSVRGTIEATMDCDVAARRRWDVLVVGAGPAGAAAAIVLAQQGADVLLIDKQRFPRPKVCGCCVNAAALAALARLGVPDCVADLGAMAIDEFQLCAGERAARLPMRGGAALSRAALDAALVRRAIDAGAQFISGMQARSMDSHASEAVVHVQHERQSFAMATSVVIAADGLAGRFGAIDDGVVARGSLMGAGVVVDGVPSWCESGVIYMACGRGGYAGVARLERGRVAISAALDPRQTRAAGGPAAMVRRLFEEAGLPAPCDLEAQRWKGTPLLTRRRRDVASMRCLVAGDATGYVEPFTGEGIAWALESGMAAAQIAHEGAREWKVALADEWQRVQRRMLGWRRLRCYWLTRALRSPMVARTAVALLAHVPTLASPIVRGVSSGWSHEPAWGR